MGEEVISQTANDLKDQLLFVLGCIATIDSIICIKNNDNIEQSFIDEFQIISQTNIKIGKMEEKIKCAKNCGHHWRC
jgi:hypothetical protein